MPDIAVHPYDIQVMVRDVPCRYCGQVIPAGQDGTVVAITYGYSGDGTATTWGHPDCILMDSRIDLETGQTELQQFLEQLHLRELRKRSDAWWEGMRHRQVMPSRMHNVDLVGPVNVRYEVDASESTP